MGEIRDAQQTDGVLVQTHVGGQALIEGIMMRGRYNWAVAVRQPDGTIYTEQHDLASGQAGNGWMHRPVVRGCTALVESLGLGYRALEISAEHAYDFSDEDEEPGGDGAGSPAPAAEPLSDDASDGSQHLLKDNQMSKTYDAPAARCGAEASLSDDAYWTDAAGWQALSTGGGPSMHDGASERPTGRVGADAEPFATRESAVASDRVFPAGDLPLSSEATSASRTPRTGQDAGDEEVLPKGLMTFSMALGLLLGIAIFIVAPAALTNLIMGDYGEHTFAWNLVDGFIRVGIFILYVWGISFMKDIRRMFAYHGAEHKTIHCYEHGCALTPEQARCFPRLHVRCGTAFLIITLLIAIIVFTILPITPLIAALGITNGIAKLGIVILSRIILFPVVAGLAYEVTVKWAGSHPENPLVKVVLWPGMQMQRLTTNQPDDGMLECAIAAMQLVLEREEDEAKARGTQQAAGLLPLRNPLDSRTGETTAA